jgi:hypothetical protein
MRNIHEVPVYDGKTKVWRILNISTGTIYSGDDPTEEAALRAIEDGKQRAGATVRAWRLEVLQAVLDRFINERA